MRQLQRRANVHLLKDVAKDCFEAKKSELRGDRLSGRWFSPLKHHVLPKLGSTPVSQLNQLAIKDALAPLWRDKPVTAVKALNRLGIIIKHAAAMGLEVDLQATTKARLLLGKPRHEVLASYAVPAIKDVTDASRQMFRASRERTSKEAARRPGSSNCHVKVMICCPPSRPTGSLLTV
jgi:hypothetical protein